MCYDCHASHGPSEMFSRNANGVRAIYGSPAFAPTPLALGLNVKRLSLHRIRSRIGEARFGEALQSQAA